MRMGLYTAARLCDNGYVIDGWQSTRPRRAGDHKLRPRRTAHPGSVWSRLVKDCDVADRPFARIYYVDLARDYPDVWTDDASLAAYVRLLSMADTTWPVTPEIPRSVKRTMVERLIGSSLITVVPPYGYEVKGFNAERSARSDKASNAANARYARSSATGSASSSANGNAYARASRPDQTRPTPDPEQLSDPQTMTSEEQTEAYAKAMERRTGVKL